MSYYEETVSKFLSELNVDLVKDIVYFGKIKQPTKCVCGQTIKKGYLFFNKKNNKKCIVGYNCLQHVIHYLGW